MAKEMAAHKPDPGAKAKNKQYLKHF